MTGVALPWRRRHRSVVSRSGKAGRVLMAHVARLRAWDVICRFPRCTTRTVVAGGASPWRHARVIERRRDPASGAVARITGGSRVGPAFVAGRNAARDRGVVTIGARRRGHYRVVHRRRDPASRPMATIAGNSPVGPTLVIRWDARRRHPMTRLTGAWGHTRMAKCRWSPGGRSVTGAASPRCHPAFVPRRYPGGN